MVQQLQPDASTTVNYPDSDGQPMADNTKQFRWIVVIKENRLFRSGYAVSNGNTHGNKPLSLKLSKFLKP